MRGRKAAPGGRAFRASRREVSSAMDDALREAAERRVRTMFRSMRDSPPSGVRGPRADRRSQTCSRAKAPARSVTRNRREAEDVGGMAMGIPRGAKSPAGRRSEPHRMAKLPRGSEIANAAGGRHHRGGRRFAEPAGKGSPGTSAIANAEGRRSHRSGRRSHTCRARTRTGRGRAPSAPPGLDPPHGEHLVDP
jgi:hypothetical protein